MESLNCTTNEEVAALLVLLEMLDRGLPYDYMLIVDKYDLDRRDMQRAIVDSERDCMRTVIQLHGLSGVVLDSITCSFQNPEHLMDNFFVLREDHWEGSMMYDLMDCLCKAYIPSVLCVKSRLLKDRVPSITYKYGLDLAKILDKVY